ncbi:MAG: mercuric transporter MerT family protein [Thermodesulfobacteriota bacterium]
MQLFKTHDFWRDKADMSLDKSHNKSLFTVAGIAAAIGASACCILPLVFFALGISGAWIGNLFALEPYKPYFIVAAILFLGFGFYKVYRKPTAESCERGTFCARRDSDRINKISLWLAAILVGLAILWPYIAPVLLKSIT